MRRRKLPDNLRAKPVTPSELLDEAIEHTERHPTALDRIQTTTSRVHARVSL
jgi:hypothetical protein